MIWWMLLGWLVLSPLVAVLVGTGIRLRDGSRAYRGESKPVEVVDSPSVTVGLWRSPLAAGG